MPRRSILSAAERASLLLPPDAEDELIWHYAFSETDLSLIHRRRGDAVQLCLLRFSGQGLLPNANVPAAMDRTAIAHRAIRGLNPTIAKVRVALEHLRKNGILSKPSRGNHVIDDRLLADHVAQRPWPKG